MITIQSFEANETEYRHFEEYADFSNLFANISGSDGRATGTCIACGAMVSDPNYITAVDRTQEPGRQNVHVVVGQVGRGPNFTKHAEFHARVGF